MPRLCEPHRLTILFDFGISELLRLDDRAIAASFDPVALIHVVSSKSNADEILLDVASEVTAYVISNDRLIDFPDMEGVARSRIIRHEILNSIVYVRNLEIAIQFPSPAQCW